MSKKHKHTTNAADTSGQQPQSARAQEAQDAPKAPQQAAVERPDYYEPFVRLSAEFENFRKRTEREKASFLAFGKKQLAEKLLPSYEVLLRQAEKWNGEDALCQGETKSILEGVNLILAEMEKAFHSEGIKRMEVLHKPYDPSTQEVVAMLPVAQQEQDGTVLQEVQMGFTMDGQVLRLARVIVGQYNGQETEK